MTSHPENTIPALLAAVEQGAPMVEFDLRLTRDGVPVVLHDASLDRTTNGSGPLAEFTLAEIRELEARAGHGAEFTGVRIPTFEEVLELLPRNIWINCQLKEPGPCTRKAAQMVMDAGRTDQLFFACKREAAEQVREVDRSLFLCNLERREDSSEYVDITLELKAQFIQFSRSFTPEDVARLRAHGVGINYFKARTIEEARQLIEQGVAFVLVDDYPHFQRELPLATAGR